MVMLLDYKAIPYCPATDNGVIWNYLYFLAKNIPPYLQDSLAVLARHYQASEQPQTVPKSFYGIL